MKASRRLAIVMLFALLIPSAISGFLPTALAQDNGDQVPTVEFNTDQSFYMPGETVYFEGSGFETEGEYTITVTLPDDSTTGIPFTADADGNIPADTSMVASQKGTYAAAVEEVDIHFGVWGTDETDYTYPDVVVISGGGIYPETTFDIDIVNETGDSAVGYPKNIDASADGEFVDQWDFYYASTALYTITLSGTGTHDHPDEEFSLQTTISVTVTPEGRAESIVQDIEDKKTEIIEEYVALGSITDIEGALIAKLTNIAKKIQQAIGWLGTSKDKVASNMLKAAWNKLRAFINQVRAQRGKHIDAEVADALIDQAEQLRGLIQGLRDELAPSPPPEESSTELSVGNRNNGKGKAKGHWKHSWKGNGKGKAKGKDKPF